MKACLPWLTVHVILFLASATCLIIPLSILNLWAHLLNLKTEKAGPPKLHYYPGNSAARSYVVGYVPIGIVVIVKW